MANKPTSILILDDDQDFIEMITVGLTLLGYDVASFTNPSEALRVFFAQPDSYRVVVTDVFMVGSTGIDFARTIRSVSKTTRIMFISGLAETLEDERGSLRDVGDTEASRRTGLSLGTVAGEAAINRPRRPLPPA